MAKKQYNVRTGRVAALPRSERLRGLGLTVASGGVSSAAAVDISGKLDRALFDRMFEWVDDGVDAEGNPTGHIRAKAGVVAPWMSAPEAAPGFAGVVEAVRLAALEDVGLTALRSGDVLSWDGSKWTNKAIQQGLDTSAGDARYVTLETAQKIAGVKTFTSRPEFNAQAIINGAATDFAAYPELKWHIPGRNRAVLKMDANGHLHLLSGAATSWDSYKNLEAGAFVRHGGTSVQFLKADGSVDATAYVNKAGDTMSGMLTINNRLLISDAGKTIEANITSDNFFGVGGASNGLVNLGRSNARWATVYANAINVTSDALVSNLNADMLDGLHNGDLTAINMNVSGYMTDCNAVYQRNGIYSFDKNAANRPCDYGTIFQIANVNYPANGGNGVWLSQFANGTYHQLYWRTRTNTEAWMGWKQIAFTDSNVASATKLANIRTIWGQNFNGEGNVSGNMTGVGSITFEVASAVNIDIYGNIKFKSDNTANTWNVTTYGGVRALCCRNDGNVGFGTQTPTEKCHIVGKAYITQGAYSDGYLSAKGNAGSSDARLKTNLRPFELTLQEVAAAPLVEFNWNDDGGEDVGSIAQYWLTTAARRAVSLRPDGVYYQVDYGKLATAIGISLARKVQDHERRLSTIERRLAV